MRTKSIKHVYMQPEPGIGGSQPAGQAQQQQQPQPGQQQQAQQQTTETNQQNNRGTNEPDFVDFWNKPTENSPAAAQAQQQVPQQLPQQVSPDDRKRQYLDKANLVDLDGLSAALGGMQEEGGVAAAASTIKTIVEQAFLKGLQESAQYSKQLSEKAGQSAVAQANTNYQADVVTNMMSAQLPFTENPAVAPIAKTVLSQALAKGDSPDKAIETVKQYFAFMQTQMNASSPPDAGMDGGYRQQQPATIDMSALFGPVE